MTAFVDSAYAPSLAQVRAAVARGIGAWAFYLAGPGALNNWTPAEVAVLVEGGITKGLPIFVPELNLAGMPQQDAQRFVLAMDAANVSGVGAIDTEASMRGNANLITYVNAFVDELSALGVIPVVYAGGDYVPTGVLPWWIEPGATSVPSEMAFQVGSGEIDGLSVDFDIAGDSFPLASLVPPTPVPPDTPTNYPGDNVTSTPITVAIAAGEGWCPSPVPVAKVVNVVIDDENPEVVNRYDVLPTFVGGATEAGPHSPNGSLNFRGTVDGTFGAVVWSVD